MQLRVKNWEKFQHYKSGRGAPPWIKLHRGLLNDKEWFSLDSDAAKFLISTWILAAEYDGNLPDIETLAFRLRIDSKTISKYLALCSHWIISDDSEMLATCYQFATPETEADTEEKRKEKKRIAKTMLTFSEWFASLNGEKPLRDDDPIFEYCEKAGISDDVLIVCWKRFKDEYASSDKKYKDWREVFRKAVRGNWHKVYYQAEGEVKLTTVGITAMRVHQEAA